MLQMTMSDSVFSYTYAVLCDDLLLLELCDAIHEENGLLFLRLFVVGS